MGQPGAESNIMPLQGQIAEDLSTEQIIELLQNAANNSLEGEEGEPIDSMSFCSVVKGGLGLEADTDVDDVDAHDHAGATATGRMSTTASSATTSLASYSLAMSE
jgi:hypothetical protein